MLKGGKEGQKHVVEQDKLQARSEGKNGHTTRARCLGSEIRANSDWLTEQFALLMHVITLNFGLRNPTLYLIACHTTST